MEKTKETHHDASVPVVYACRNKKGGVRRKSSSGGVFYALAAFAITQKSGVVYGCVIENGYVHHERAETISNVIPMLGSKYVRSDLKGCFILCAEDLQNNRFVLFSGTPCQINALHHYLDKNGVRKSNLVCVDVICHGTPKPNYWRDYLKQAFKDDDLANISFRYKAKGEDSRFIRIGEYVASFENDPYIQSFLRNEILCESCFNCKSKGEQRKADITLGDFWGLENIDSRKKSGCGTSLVVLRNQTHLLLSVLTKECYLAEVPYVSSLFPLNSPYYSSVNTTDQPNQQLSLSILKNPESKKRVSATLAKFSEKIKELLRHLGHKPFGIYRENGERQKNGRVGIITDYGYGNFGNRLQNYALRQCLQALGKVPINIRFSAQQETLLGKAYKLLRRQKPRGFPFTKAIYLASKKYEGETFVFTKTKKRQKALCQFETVLVGSDQIWNATYHPYAHDLEYSLGNFGILNPPFKLSSYAASICMEEMSTDQQFLFHYSLKKFDYISVREQQSKRLLESIKIESEVALDPTLLLNKEAWDYAIERYSSRPLPNDYVFVYLLDAELDELPLLSSQKIINIQRKDDPFFHSNQFDFINLIKHANVVVTNSFHGLVFSIIYGKKTFLQGRNRKGMAARVEELLRALGLVVQYDSYYDFSTLDPSSLEGVKQNSWSCLEKAIS